MQLGLSTRLACTLIPSLAMFLACGGRTVGKKAAHTAILQSTGDIFREQDVDVKSVDPVGSGQIVVEADVRAAFALKKIDKEWVVQDVRLGRQPWERLDSILKALEQINVRETEDLLQRVAAALENYYKEKGALPEFKDYVALSDILSPKYLTPLIRLDAWRNPLLASRLSPSAVRILSAGPDGKVGTADDIETTRHFP